MNTLRLFPHESTNSQQGSDVLEGGESNRMASLKFSRLDLDVSSRIRGRGERQHQRLNERIRTLSSWSGVFILQRQLSALDDTP
jgi:hypothetical protein